MKRCPQCHRIETDEALKFCRVDGAVLITDENLDEFSATEMLPQVRATAGSTAGTTEPEVNTSSIENRQSSGGTASALGSTTVATRGKWVGRHKVAIIFGIVVVVAGTIALGVYRHARSSEVAIDSIAVLPFDSRSSDADSEYLSDGLAESLIYRLSQLPNLRVSPTSTVLRYKGQQNDPIEVGKRLGVSAVLSGRITQRGDNLTISAELVDVRYNKLLWGEQYDRKLSDLLNTQREIAREIADSLKVKVSPEERGLAKHYTESNEAYQLYMKGRFYYDKRTKDGMEKALQNFQQAIEKDPNFALAYSGLADTYDLMGTPDAGGLMRPNDAMPKARVAAQRAIDLDQSLAEPHVSLAHVKYYYDRDWRAAEYEFKRAIELNPNYPLAHHWYSIYLLWSGRTGEGLAEIRRAQELDPLSLPINMTLGWLLCDSQKTDEGIEQLHKTLEMDQGFIVAHHRLALCYERKGMYTDAIAEYQKIDSLGSRPLALSGLAQAYAMAGKRNEAQKALAKLQEISKQQYVGPSSFALIYAALGDKDQAFVWLEKSLDEHDLVMARLNVDARFDPLRSDARFATLVQRAGLH